ncbi:unnamed protein product [Lathyrus sativus]|nr:unnamed protein product [Lathyrus sativus]
MSPPQNQPENHQSDAEPSDPSLNQPPPESPEPELAGGEEEEEEGECGFCLFMKGGGCKDTFVDWENCVKEAEDKNEDLVEKCSQVTAKLKQCMDSNSDYYEPILRAEKHAEEQVAIELEKEKKDSEATNNRQEAPSQSNQNDRELELKATPTPPKQDEKEQSNSEAEKRSPDQPASEAPKAEDKEEEEEEEGECGFCVFMKGGGCRDTFVNWENCVTEAEENKEDIVEKCSQVTFLLKECMDSHSDYYAPILVAEKQIEEQAVIELEKEKLDSATTNNEQEAPSHSNQK